MFDKESRRKRQLKKTIAAIGKDVMRDVVVPDGVDGEIQIDYLLLTAHGLLVLDVKAVDGIVFGGANVDNWTVIDDKRRFSFRNPVGPVQQRIIALKTLLEDVPVIGRVVFAGDAEPTRDMPDMVVSLAGLADEFAPERHRTSATLDAYYPYWDRLRRIAVAA